MRTLTNPYCACCVPRSTLGATDAFRDSASMGAGYKFHSIPEIAYLAAFDGAVLGAGSGTACALGLSDEQAAASMLRSKLGEVLDEALGRSATLQEVKAWYKFLDFDAGGCIIGRPEFTAAIAALRNFSSRPGRAVSYNSHARWVADRAQHRRVDWEARTCLQEPLTAAQQARVCACAAAPCSHCQLCAFTGHVFMYIHPGMYMCVYDVHSTGRHCKCHSPAVRCTSKHCHSTSCCA
jgi:hypothetical protein